MRQNFTLLFLLLLAGCGGSDTSSGTLGGGRRGGGQCRRRGPGLGRHAAKFITPTVADGRVYVGTRDGIAVFGLLH